ncbi:hypothetical protein AUJ14_01910 [Candidatus Micrarchaeota archaeon CG1_02_55_22]|nr:MAG: hypothetical protein AUJ14_01910 [Candidatus Micrarchaeota archaeon CG1_02_55_22]
MKLPFGTITLAIVVIAAYVYASNGALYLSDTALEQLSFSLASSPAALFTHQFLHVGPLHLLGNLLPLIVFGLLLETVLSSVEIIVIFLTAGIISSILFSFTNPLVSLVGASTGVAGLMGAAAVARPKLALSLLLLTPVILYLVIFPLATDYTRAKTVDLVSQQQQLTEQVDSLVVQTKSNTSTQLQEQLAQTQSARQDATQQRVLVESGKEREHSTPSDFLVHVYGILVGIAYVALFHQRLVKTGAQEFKRLIAFANRKL